MTNNLFSRIREGIEDGGRTWMVTEDGRRLTYDDMFEATGRMANTLRSLGLQPGDRVVLQAEKSPEYILFYLAALRSGVVFVPLNTAYTANELDYFVGDADPRLVILDPARAGNAERLRGGAQDRHVMTLDAAGQGSFTQASSTAPSQFDDFAAEAGSPAAILYTSGTTGRSKGAVLSHENLASNALTLVDYWRFSERDVLLHALPVYHAHGLFVACNTAMLSGASIIFQAKFTAERVVAELHRATVFMGVPTFYTRLLEQPGLNADAVRDMRLFISGSAPLLAETHKAFREKTGLAILERYGMTETTMIASNPYDGERVAGTVGFPLPGISVRIADAETGRVLGRNEIGVLEVRGPNVFGGYWRMPEKTREEFRADGYFITGDMATIDDAGYVHIVGRAKDLIITGGFNVYPKEIEGEIDAMAGVVESAVIGVPHPDFGEGVTAVVVAEPGSKLSDAALVEALAERLAKFKLPKRVFFVPELPRNTMGKVQKNLLRDQYKTIYSS